MWYYTEYVLKDLFHQISPFDRFDQVDLLRVSGWWNFDRCLLGYLVSLRWVKWAVIESGICQHLVDLLMHSVVAAKVSQAYQSNKARNTAFPFKTGDRVVLSMLHRRREFRANDRNRVAKFMPRFDGPFVIKNTDEKHSTVTLDLPNQPNIFPSSTLTKSARFQKITTPFSLLADLSLPTL